MSTNLTVAPQWIIADAEAVYVYAGIITSSPGPMPNTLRLSSSAAVAELKHTNLLLYFAGFLSVSTSVLPFLIYAASLLSRSFTLGPVVIQPLLNVSTTS